MDKTVKQALAEARAKRAAQLDEAQHRLKIAREVLNPSSAADKLTLKIVKAIAADAKRGKR